MYVFTLLFLKLALLIFCTIMNGTMKSAMKVKIIIFNWNLLITRGKIIISRRAKVIMLFQS